MNYTYVENLEKPDNDFKLVIKDARELIHDVFPKELVEYATDMTDIALAGLNSRKLGEESLLEGLYYRAENLHCPAKYIIENKDDIDNVIKEYSEF